MQKGWTKFEKDECWFKPNHIMQAVTWMYLEEKVFAEWYPGVEDAGTKEGFGKLEEMVRGGGKFYTLSFRGGGYLLTPYRQDPRI